MKHRTVWFAAFLLSFCMLTAEALTQFETNWVPSRPQMLTFKTTGPEGEGIYQLSIYQQDSLIEVYVNMITRGFTKTVSGLMRSDLRPLRSQTKILVDGNIVMNTRCEYEKDSVHIVTDMEPYHQRLEKTLMAGLHFIDFSQIPFVPIMLRLAKGAEFSFSSINPRTNSEVACELKVVGEEKVDGINCFKLETKDFEGESLYWIEQGGTHRILRIDQPTVLRTSHLMR